MTIKLIWTSRAETSALHAAAVVSSGRRVIQPDLVAELRPLVVRADEFVGGFAVTPRDFWNLGCAVSLLGQGTREIVTLWRRRMFGSSAAVADAHLIDLLGPIFRWGQSAHPDFAATMKLIESPLKLQWEARGPGLLRYLSQLTRPELLPPSATVALVRPLAGGDGAAHLDFNSVRLEAVLANPVAELPEVVRLAWLVSQLQADLPVYSDALNKKRLPWLAGLAMLPAALEAAQFVELVHVDRDLLHTAVLTWILPAYPENSATADELVTAVCQWWDIYQQNKPPWAIALAALDRLLPA